MKICHRKAHILLFHSSVGVGMRKRLKLLWKFGELPDKPLTYHMCFVFAPQLQSSGIWLTPIILWTRDELILYTICWYHRNDLVSQVDCRYAQIYVGAWCSPCKKDLRRPARALYQPLVCTKRLDDPVQYCFHPSTFVGRQLWSC